MTSPRASTKAASAPKTTPAKSREALAAVCDAHAAPASSAGGWSAALPPDIVAWLARSAADLGHDSPRAGRDPVAASIARQMARAQAAAEGAPAPSGCPWSWAMPDALGA